jgi:hypothetical protein
MTSFGKYVLGLFDVSGHITTKMFYVTCDLGYVKVYKSTRIHLSVSDIVTRLYLSVSDIVILLRPPNPRANNSWTTV